jgi:hypothetical protein
MFFSTDRTRYNSLCAKYQVKAFPSLIVLSSSGQVLTYTGVQEIYNNSADSIRQWAKGNCLIFSCISYKEKYVLDGVSCSLLDAQTVPIVTAFVIIRIIIRVTENEYISRSFRWLSKLPFNQLQFSWIRYSTWIE